MDSQQFENYLKQARTLAAAMNKDHHSKQRLLELIETQQASVAGQTFYEEFFKGERCFYNGQYEHALRHYLEANSVPNYQFFCYRASCYVSKERGNPLQAMNFVLKALKIDPEDPMMMAAEEELKFARPKPASAEEGPAEGYGQSEFPQAGKEREPVQKIALGEKEIQELAHIFEGTEGDEDGLFTKEAPQTHPLHSMKGGNEHKLPTRNGSPAAFSKSPFEEAGPNFLETFTESSMNTGSDIFSSPTNQGEPSSDSLTQRLYAYKHEPAERLDPSGPAAASTYKALEELKKLALEDFKLEGHGHPPGMHQELENALDQRIKSFQNAQAALMNDYLEASRKHSKLAEHRLYILNGWSDTQLELSTHLGIPINRSLLTEESRKATGGHYLRWNGKGIVINPGPGFLENFHQQGLCIKDIDFVIITRNHPDAYADVKEIYALNNQLNRVSSELQIIHYYLNQQAYQDLSSRLKPNFKQARHTVHNLELFLDSPDVEKIELSEGITLNYFLTTSQEPFYRKAHLKDERFAKTPEILGIRLDLEHGGSYKTPDSHMVRLGYVSGTAWSPLLAHHLGSCHVLIAGFGNTNPNDYSKIAYNEDCLGYHGTYSLLEEVSPNLLLSTEFEGREGDIRIEAIKKMRQELSHAHHFAHHAPVILPADIGLFIDLKSLQIQCSVSRNFVDPSKIHVVKSRESFGRLQYLSSSCCI